MIQERDGNDNVIANNIWDGNIGGLEARVVYDINTPANPPQKYFYHYDGSGNVTAVTDDSQSTVASYNYDAYGNQLNASGAYALQNSWRFSTKYYDDGSGMYYYGYRFYSPGLGRWINRDPLRESGSLNVYAFGLNSPINGYDPYGLDWVTNVSNFSAGAGDALTLGATKYGRKWLGNGLGVGDANESVDYCSGWYAGGEVTGTGIGLAMGGAGLVKGSAGLAVEGAEAINNGSQGIRVAIGAGESSDSMQIVREIQHGEKAADLIQELKELTYTTDNEHAIVELSSGERAIVSGGEKGIEFGDQITRLFAHTHPYHLGATGPLAADVNALQQLGQRSSYLLEHGEITKFFR